MIKKEKAYASIILRLLLDQELDCDRENIQWGDLFQIAAQNGVLIRVVDQLENIGLEPRHFFSAAVKEMRARNQRELALIGQISQRCLEADLDFIFPKAVQNYPDMGTDIDLYVAHHSLSVDTQILKGLRATRLSRRLRNVIDGTANYRIPGCESRLEIHHGRIGALGEHKQFINQIIDNSQCFRVEGQSFLVPSPEDQLILQALQRVVQRSYLRLSDVVCTISLLRRGELNWNYVFKTVEELNISYGLSCYLSFVDRIYSETFKSNLLPTGLKDPLIKDGRKIEFRQGFYRFERISVGGLGYLDKFCSAVLSENWAVASRLSLLPLVALTSIFQKLRTSFSNFSAVA